MTGTIARIALATTCQGSTRFEVLPFFSQKLVSFIAANQLIRIQTFDKMLKIQWSGILMYENP
jgi:hypothetical protein